MPQTITSPDDPSLDELCGQLAERAAEVDSESRWPGASLGLCAEYGVYQWFLPADWGGQAWGPADIVRGYLRLSAACLTTTFVITQFTGACRRLAACSNRALQDEWLPRLVKGEAFPTLGISHLTTSRRHLKRPVMGAREEGDAFVLDGFSPWVTGGPHADLIVTGATFDDGRQILVALPTDLSGVAPQPGAKLVAVSASDTGPVECENVRVGRELLLAGPVENVMSQGLGGRTGGLQTSTLAIGLASAGIGYLLNEAEKRSDLATATESLRREHEALKADLLALADGEEACSLEELRTRANSHVLRASQAALTAAKGAGFVAGHPAGRWCREALFFLVWSCPQPVMAANLCELAGISDG